MYFQDLVHARHINANASWSNLKSPLFKLSFLAGLKIAAYPRKVSLYSIRSTKDNHDVKVIANPPSDVAPEYTTMGIRHSVAILTIVTTSSVLIGRT